MAIDPSLPAFLINLDERTDRLATASARIARMGISFERISACDPARAEALGIRASSPQMRPGDTATVASHVVVYRTIVERELPYALILEDDIMFGVRFPSRFAAGFAALPADWSIWAAGSVDLDPLQRRSVSSLARSVAGPLVPGADRVMALPFPSGTHCYLVSLEFARHAAEHFLTPHLPIDVLIRDHSVCPPFRGRCFVSLPSLALQDQSPSSVTMHRSVAGFPAWRRWIA